ncbi:hypothetical protein [Streptomyces sp. SCA2-2]|uniref:hypothetical protein n=1 Tax=Streptomyces sp. SCA2-2 TaxID=1563677 RepID=UPI001A934350|nr:hypothetical protein [Streptomyces sp. SCA2-2]
MTQSTDGREEFHDHFRLSITKALGAQLAEALEGLGSVELSERNLAALEERPGVYQLYGDDRGIVETVDGAGLGIGLFGAGELVRRFSPSEGRARVGLGTCPGG